MMFSRQITRYRNLVRLISSVCEDMACSLQEFNPPSWAEHVKNVPKQKVQLANLPTPIHAWKLTGVPAEFSLSIKRDDMTGSTLSGNKVRKLEFLMAEALVQNCRHVISCGSLQSNHCRAVATCARQLGMTPHLVLRSEITATLTVMHSRCVTTLSNHCRAVAACARQLGMTPHLVLRSEITDPNDVGCEGNVLLDRMFASHLYLVPKKSPYIPEIKNRMDKIEQHIRSTTGEASYHIPVGGSNAVGAWGYISAFEELIKQGVWDKFDDLVFACGSGGTAAGLAIGNYLSGSKLRIHAVSVSDDAVYFHQHVNEMLEALGINTRSEDILNVIDGHKGQGYGISSQDQLDFVLDVSSTTGIVLDPVYTGKAVKGLVQELNDNPGRFQGRRVLYLHTGGVFGLYAGRINDTLKQASAASNLVKTWTDLDDSPL